MWEKIKAFYNKEGYTYDKGFGDPKKFHTIFFFLLDAFQVIDEKYSLFSYFSKFYVIFCGTFVCLDAAFSFYHGLDLKDVFFTAEAGTYVILLVYKFIIIASTYINLPSYHKLIRAIKADFRYINTKEQKYRDIFYEFNLDTWKLCVWTVIFMILLAMVQIIFAFLVLLYYFIKHTPGDGMVRRLVFPFWAPGIDYTKTPAFECAFVFANVGVTAYAYNFLFNLQTDLVWIREISVKAVLAVQCLKDLLVDIEPAKNLEEKERYADLIRFRMREIIQLHHSLIDLTYAYADVYKKNLMFEQFFAAPAISFLAYCSIEKLDQGEFNAQLIMLCVGTIVVIYIPCYLCTYLREQIMTISDTCWDIPHWNAGPVIAPYIVLIMMMCSRPLPLQAAGFQEVSIKTFSNIMTTAYSYFNMLRQLDLDF